MPPCQPFLTVFDAIQSTIGAAGPQPPEGSFCVSDRGLDHYIADIAAGKGRPEGTDGGELPAAWLERTLQYLSQYNPYACEGGEDSFVIDTILD
jgi:hypothetical protein